MTQRDEGPTPAAGTIGTAGTITIGDLTVNRLGFGAMRVTGRGIWGEPAHREDAKMLLRRVVERGVNFIDTADSYGPEVSETLIAEALHPYPDGVVIATKGGLERPGPDRWSPNGSPDHLREACEGSLRRLRLDQIPVYQFHRPDSAVPLEDSVGALVELQAQGKIRHIGLSNVSADQLDQAQAIASVVTVQNRYNLTDRSSEAMVDRCAQEAIAFLPWAPIQGLGRSRTVKKIAKGHSATPTQVVLAWLLARSPAIVPIPGTASVEHLEENLAAARVALTDDEVDAITGER